MEKKNLVFGTIIIISLLISFASIAISNKNARASPPTALPECSAIQTGEEGAISVVFIADKKTAQDYVDYLMQISPFKEEKQRFSFSYVDEEPSCNLYQNIALLCNDAQTKKIASACAHDYIVSIDDTQSRSIRSSSIGKYVSINKKQPPSVLAHELGHSIFNFGEEYNAGKDAQPPRGSVNCQSSSENFEEFEGGYDGVYLECTNQKLYRSYENGIMRTLNSNSYGLFDQNRATEEIEIQSVKTSQVTGFAVQENTDCATQTYDLIEGTYENGQINVLSKEKATGCAGSPERNGVLSYKVLSGNQEQITEGTALPEFIFTTDSSENLITAPQTKNDQPFIITIPETEKANALEILKENGETVIINLNDIEARPCRA